MDALFALAVMFLIGLMVGNSRKPSVVTEEVVRDTGLHEKDVHAAYLSGFAAGYDCKQQGYAIEVHRTSVVCTKIVDGKPVVLRIKGDGSVSYVAGKKVGARRTNKPVPPPQEPPPDYPENWS